MFTKPIHCGDAKTPEKSQREEERERVLSSLLSHFFSLRFLCGLCVSAVNGLT
jgi:hypothetical protein